MTHRVADRSSFFTFTLSIGHFHNHTLQYNNSSSAYLLLLIIIIIRQDDIHPELVGKVVVGGRDFKFVPSHPFLQALLMLRASNAQPPPRSLRNPLAAPFSHAAAHRDPLCRCAGGSADRDHGYGGIYETDSSIVLFWRHPFEVVRRTVALALPDQPQVDHKNGNGKGNNAADNLEWVTPKENNRRAVLRGRASSAAAQGVPVCGRVREGGGEWVTYESGAEAARVLTLDARNISRACKKVGARVGLYEFKLASTDDDLPDEQWADVMISEVNTGARVSDLGRFKSA